MYIYNTNGNDLFELIGLNVLIHINNVPDARAYHARLYPDRELLAIFWDNGDLAWSPISERDPNFQRTIDQGRELMVSYGIIKGWPAVSA